MAAKEKGNITTPSITVPELGVLVVHAVDRV